MTAEIALLNKAAVTLAADSAVTISTIDGPKIYNSADKIFEGTNHDPIGVMVYNSPELSGIPIESIVKMYRDRVCRTHYPTVFAYARAFLNHLEALETPDITIAEVIRGLIGPRTYELRNRIRNRVEELFRVAGEDDQTATIEEVIENINDQIITDLNYEIEALGAMPQPNWGADLTVNNVLFAHEDCIRRYVDFVFEDDHIPIDRRDKIVHILAFSLLKENERSQVTGLVFAGFGEDEIFPSLVAYEVYGTIAGRLKFFETTKFDVDRSLVPDAAIIPFAQKEMVDRFMYGLDEDFLQIAQSYFSGALGSLKTNIEAIVEQIVGAGDAASQAIDSILDEFNNTIVHGHLTRVQSEFSNMVRSMPKQELAALAESLVHITSLKRKFSAGAESVGGPIDVAVITRAEGFVWVRRKHYFDPALNPRFFFRRYNNQSNAPNFGADSLKPELGAGQ